MGWREKAEPNKQIHRKPQGQSLSSRLGESVHEILHRELMLMLIQEHYKLR